MAQFNQVVQSAVEASSAEQNRRTNRVKVESITGNEFKATKKNPEGRPTRVLPPVDKMELPWVTVHRHELRDPYAENANMITSWACPQAHGGGRCLLCEMRDKVKNKDPQLHKMLSTKQRYSCFIVDIEGKGTDVTIRKYEFGSTVLSGLLQMLKKVDFTSFSNGCSINIAYDKSKPGALMWSVALPFPFNPDPLSDATVEAIQEAYPEGGPEAYIFVPSLAWQTAAISPGGDCASLNLPLELLSDLPSVSDAAPANTRSSAATTTRASSGSRSQSNGITNSDYHVSPEDDVGF